MLSTFATKGIAQTHEFETVLFLNTLREGKTETPERNIKAFYQALMMPSPRVRPQEKKADNHSYSRSNSIVLL